MQAVSHGLSGSSKTLTPRPSIQERTVASKVAVTPGINFDSHLPKEDVRLQSSGIQGANLHELAKAIDYGQSCQEALNFSVRPADSPEPASARERFAELYAAGSGCEVSLNPGGSLTVLEGEPELPPGQNCANGVREPVTEALGFDFRTLAGAAPALAGSNPPEQEAAAVRKVLDQLGSHLPEEIRQKVLDRVPLEGWQIQGAGRMPNGDVLLVSLNSNADKAHPYESKLFVASEKELKEVDIPDQGYERWGNDDVIVCEGYEVYLPGRHSSETPTARSHWHRQLGRILKYDVDKTPIGVIDSIWMNGASAAETTSRVDLLPFYK